MEAAPEAIDEALEILLLAPETAEEAAAEAELVIDEMAPVALREVAEARALLRLEEREALAEEREEMMLELCEERRDRAEEEAEAIAVSSPARVEVMVMPDMEMGIMDIEAEDCAIAGATNATATRRFLSCMLVVL